MEINNQINYIEFKGHDLDQVKAFYASAFGWIFTDYGPTYTAFSESGIAGGFEYSEEPVINGALVVLYHKELEKIKERVLKSGGSLVQDIFSFPGGRRFHFKDPSGNELAIWSEE